ncbi:MAG: tetratricopeptide repeat protein [Bacteroidetes bacterium]|nr:tetratricopeptide repeat protein [Bacteroidota bacterium]
MKNRLPTVPVSKKDQIDKLIVNARNLISTDIKKSFRLANEGLQMSQEIFYKKGEADALRTIGINYDAQNKLGKALEMYKKAMPFYIALGDKQGEAMLYNNFGIIDFKHAKYISAMNYYFQSLKIKEDLGDLRGVSSSYTNIGSVYQRQNNHKTATKFYKKALLISKQIQDVFLTAAL